MRLNKTISFYLLLLFCFGTQLSARAQVYDFVVHDRESGIAGIKINDIDQDDNGYLWIATNSGLSRFDGKNFVNYFEKNGLSENHCTTVFCGDDGRVWVGHQTTGISIIKGKSPTNLSEETGLANNEIHDIFESTDGSIWVATFGGVSILNGEEWETITTADGLASNNIQVVAQDTDNRIWLGSYGTGITILDNGVAKGLHRGHGLINNYVTSLVPIGDRMPTAAVRPASLAKSSMDGCRAAGPLRPRSDPAPPLPTVGCEDGRPSAGATAPLADVRWRGACPAQRL